MAESRNEILRISRRDRKHDNKEIQVPENKEISNSYLMFGMELISNRRRKYLCMQCSS